jgi:hypothetical protein
VCVHISLELVVMWCLLRLSVSTSVASLLMLCDICPRVTCVFDGALSLTPIPPYLLHPKSYLEVFAITVRKSFLGRTLIFCSMHDFLFGWMSVLILYNTFCRSSFHLVIIYIILFCGFTYPVSDSLCWISCTLSDW